jgi:xanthine dehydrogenase/oxidase
MASMVADSLPADVLIAAAGVAAAAAAAVSGWFNLDAPATPEKLRMACADQLTAPYAPQDLQPLMSC